MGHFVLKAKTDLKNIDDTTKLESSDYAITSGGVFYQFQYKSEKKRETKDVYPGIYSITKTAAGLILNETKYTSDNLLKEFVNTVQIEEAADCFFNNLHLYKEFGYDVPKRSILLYGTAGSGKSSAIGIIANKYVADGKTSVLIWPTDIIDAYEVKELFKMLKYNDVEKIILVIEDLGGIENPEKEIISDSSLLALLDNNEKSFTIPTLIISTTNFPECFASNITNRPGRFDDKIEIGIPDGESRKALLKFFSNNKATEEELTLLGSKFCEFFTQT